MHALLFRLRWLSALTVLTLLSSVGAGQQPRLQQQDEDFARSVKEWTTKPEFISPLVDHLPKIPGVPSPKDVLGHHIGAPGKLTYHADAVAYFRALAAKTPRVKVYSIGTTDEGRDCVVVAVGSEESIKNIDQYRAYLAQLADPRKLTDEQAREVIAKAKTAQKATPKTFSCLIILNSRTSSASHTSSATILSKPTKPSSSKTKPVMAMPVVEVITRSAM